MIVLLDAGVLSLLASPNTSPEVYQCTNWLYSLLSKGVYVVVSQISDYEVRREFVRIKSKGIQKLDALKNAVDFLPITEEVMLKAAELWAEAREQNQPTANNQNLDADMILSAQWRVLKDEFPGRYVVVATYNLRHLKQFTEAQEWKDIRI